MNLRRLILKKTFTLAAAVLCLAATLSAGEDWRGNNRLAGVVVDKTTGKQVANPTIKLRKGSSGGPDVTGDGNGKWAILPIWDDAQPFHEGLAYVGTWKAGKTAYIDHKGRIIWEGRNAQP